MEVSTTKILVRECLTYCQTKDNLGWTSQRFNKKNGETEDERVLGTTYDSVI